MSPEGSSHGKGDGWDRVLDGGGEGRRGVVEPKQIESLVCSYTDSTYRKLWSISSLASIESEQECLKQTILPAQSEEEELDEERERHRRPVLPALNNTKLELYVIWLYDKFSERPYHWLKFD